MPGPERVTVLVASVSCCPPERHYTPLTKHAAWGGVLGEGSPGWAIVTNSTLSQLSQVQEGIMIHAEL
jgi:hypothetical protein